jgi:hypothetical protein
MMRAVDASLGFKNSVIVGGQGQVVVITFSSFRFFMQASKAELDGVG